MGTVLDKLATIISTEFVKATLFPIAVFLIVNTALWHFHSDADIVDFITQDNLLHTSAAGAALLAVFAFTWNALLPVLRDILRGRYGWPFRKIAVAEMKRTRRNIENQINERLADKWRIQQQIPQWIIQLQKDFAIGVKLNQQGSYTVDSEPSERIGNLSIYPEDKLAMELDACVQAFGNQLKAQSAKLNDTLKQDHSALLKAVSAAPARMGLDSARLATWIEFQYPKGELAPTRFGNITRSVASYAETRYGINFDFFWSRIRQGLEDNRAKALTQAQAETDFFVSLVWLTLITMVLWVFRLLLTAGSPWLFVGITVGGPLAARSFYAMAVHCHGIFADLVKSALDFERKKLFTDFGFAEPSGNEHEKAMWDVLHQWLVYGEVSPLSYKNKDGS